MTISMDLPDDLAAALRARAAAGGQDLPDLLIRLLRSTVGADRANGAVPAAPLPPRLEPGVYAEDDLPAGEDAAYSPVPLPTVGTARVRFVSAGRLTPPALADDDE
jgi:hypothetical protein